MFEGLFQPTHLVVILFIALLVFGPKKLPELGKGLGDGIRSFKNWCNFIEREISSNKEALNRQSRWKSWPSGQRLTRS